ncbi:hypothetical protein [Mucilaginibacter gilvus]|uniref:Uncharacterized protein n=1 Tax=Mucilaginibacter gilvus TaxID=2305909 RepID=A0A3S3W4N4_9SPHI|nr:hypothetical protein [Mucilaginibacter gilvus]RWY48316.1 hypothetical protein EPL05_19425 [Mucilaginibacter gilvus]
MTTAVFALAGKSVCLCSNSTKGSELNNSNKMNAVNVLTSLFFFAIATKLQKLLCLNNKLSRESVNTWPYAFFSSNSLKQAMFEVPSNACWGTQAR